MSVDEIIPITEERLRVDKRVVVSGRVRVETRTETVEELASMTLDSDVIEVRRVPINREVAQAPKIRVEGNVTIVPVLEEVLVVEKRLVLKEEMHLVRRTTTETLEVPVLLRKQAAIVTRLNQDGEAINEEQS